MITHNTRQRKLIMGLMEHNASHPTADEVYEQARAQDPHISRGTVYRNLNVLAKSGLLHKLDIPGPADRFDSRLDQHYHFLCRKCAKVADAPFAYREELNALSGMDGYQLERHRLVFIGLCPKCR